MKNNTLYRILLAVCLVLPFASCVKNEDDIFDKSASVRVNEALINAKNVLTSATNGWIMHYYPEGDQIYGGYLHTMTFTDEGEVTVWSELFDDSYTSLFSMETDDGPVLSFNTNNYAFHYFATPSGSSPNQYGESDHYQAYKGDFEFMIMKATAEEVILRGKRTGNKIHMYPCPEAPESYLQKVLDLEDVFFVSSFSGTAGSDDIDMYLSLGNRQATITLPGEKYLDENGDPARVTVAYLYTDEGITFYQPTEIGPYVFTKLVFDSATNQLKDTEQNIMLQGELPEGWHNYNDFPGKYTLTYNDGAVTMEGIEIVPVIEGKTYKVTGLSPLFDVSANYDLGLGRIEITAQYVAGQEETGTDNLVMMACWDSNAGRVQYTTGGLYGILDETGNKINWVDNGNFSGYTSDGFILYFFTSAGTRVGATSEPWIWTGREALASGKHQLWGWVSFDRV